MVKPHLSASQMSTWLKCRMEWALSRDRERRPPNQGTPAQQTGTLVHRIMELYHSVPSAIRNEKYQNWCYEKASLEGEFDSTICRYARTMLAQFYAKWGADEQHNPTYVEHEITAPFTERNDLVCVLDDLTVNHETKSLMVGEYKTSLKKIEVTDKSLFQLQPHVYKLALEHAFPGYTLTGALFTMMWPGGVARLLREIPPNALFDQWIHDLAHDMETAPVIPNFTATCSWCEHHDKCEFMLMTGHSPLAGVGDTGWWGHE